MTQRSLAVAFSRRTTLVATLTALAAPRIGAAQVPAWAPTRPVRIVSGFAPGGGTDITARLLAPLLADRLGQPVIVENRPGAGGNIGTDAVVRAPADGHTILLAQGGQITVNPHTFSRMNFDPQRDLAPVGVVRTGDFALFVHPVLRVGTIQELMTLLRRDPGGYLYATTAPGGQVHVITEIFKVRAGLDIEAVHFSGSGQAMTEVLSGRVPILFNAVGVMQQHIQAGSLKALMVAADARSPLLPDVPTSSEAGIPDFRFETWFAFFAPRGTPLPIIERYAEVTRSVLAPSDVAGRIRDAGDRPGDARPDTLAELVAREYALIGQAVRSQGIRAE